MTAVAVKNRVGRPTKFNESITEKIIEWTQAGKTLEQMAELLGIEARTLTNWWRAHPEFFLAVKEARQVADDLVETSLFRKAVGYRYREEVASKHGPVMVEKLAHPDTTSCIFWLKNRRPDEWSDRSEIDITAHHDEEFEKVPRADIMELLRKANAEGK